MNVINHIDPYKGRSINFDDKVHVYRNLNRKDVVYSIWQNGLVVGHAKILNLVNCKFVVSKKGRERARKQQKRNVHAHIEGRIVNNVTYNRKKLIGITYNPFKFDHFAAISKKSIYLDSAEGVVLNQNGVYGVNVNAIKNITK